MERKVRDEIISELNSELDDEDSKRSFFYNLVSLIDERVNNTQTKHIDALENKNIKNNIPKQITDDFIENPWLLDDLYSDIIPSEYRRNRGQFFTPTDIAQFMVDKSCKQGDVVLDPACGIGAFPHVISESDKNIERLVAIDKDPLMTYSTRIRLDLIDPNYNFEVKQTDFIDYTDDLFDVVIGNPPYNKFQNHNYSEDSLNSEIQIGNLSNLYSLFFVKTNNLVKEGGVVNYITPTEFLHTGYGESIKKHFMDNYKIASFTKLNWDNSPFDALTTLCITHLTKSDKDEYNVDFIESRDRDSFPQSNKYISSVSLEDLDPTSNWNQYFKNIEGIEYLEYTKSLSEIANVKRGIATGYNEYFTLTRSDLEEWGIQDLYLKPVIPKSRMAKNYKFEPHDFDELEQKGENMYLLYYQDEQVTSELNEYIEHGVDLDANDRYLTRNRDPWYKMESRDPAPILATVFSRDDMRFVYNKKEALNLAAFHGIYPEYNSILLIKALLAYLNSDVAIQLSRLYARDYGGGLTKFEPSDLSEFPVVDIEQMDKNKQKRLASLFDKLDDTRRKSEDETSIIDRIDNEVIEYFEGISDEGK